MDPPPLLHDRAFCMIVAPKSTLRNESGGVVECLHFLSYLYPDRGRAKKLSAWDAKRVEKICPLYKKILTL